MKNYKNASKHIAVLAFPFGTHATPLLNITRRLSEAAPSLVFSFLSTEQSNAVTFPNGEKVDKIQPFNVWDGLPEGFRFKGDPHEPVEYFLKAAPENFMKAMDVVVAETGKPIDCLLVDAFLWFSVDIAADLNVPWMALWTAGPRALYVHVDTSFIRQHVGINDTLEKPLDFIEDFSSLSVADLPDGIVNGKFEAPVQALLDKLEQVIPQATAIAANSYEYLDNQVVNMLKSRFRNFLNVGETHRKKLPEGFLERTSLKGKIVPWAPQQKVLQHEAVGVFVTHGGWNSVLESITGGVPMIFRPFFGDQGLNTKTVEAVWGFGLGLEGGMFTKEATVKALKVILSSDEGKKMREKIAVQKELAFKAVEPNGSSVENFKKLVEIMSSS
ncbi:UDP-glucuronosyl/UDP-glucosyltransferase [Corchorus capsularis]|uniref:UDP-glucuronosyl/UDP-glucosyltransferase n=1 Tax=Corchorus capsularis TaxID=210143 RepID=A0A1R3J1T3_COCAP|nr:UDP-glucuronosyl/UDP-glucosyltransferase [Corchorus capsularis]